MRCENRFERGTVPENAGCDGARVSDNADGTIEAQIAHIALGGQRLLLSVRAAEAGTPALYP